MENVSCGLEAFDLDSFDAQYSSGVVDESNLGIVQVANSRVATTPLPFIVLEEDSRVASSTGGTGVVAALLPLDLVILVEAFPLVLVFLSRTSPQNPYRDHKY